MGCVGWDGDRRPESGVRVAGTWLLGILIALGACGGGGSAPSAPRDECARDLDCDDGIDCTRDACSPSVGGVRTCLHEPRDDRCAAGERCVVGVPDLTGCWPDAVAACAGVSEGGTCEVADRCATGPGTCRGGACDYSRKACPDLPCASSLGCDPGTGECRTEPLDDGAPCSYPTDPCRPAHCVAGACVPTGAPVCDDGNPCTSDICQGQTCENRPAPDGTACDDGDPCTVGEACTAGICAGGSPRDCDDHNDCTADTCDPAQGGCVSVALQDGAGCFAGGDRCEPGTCHAGACEDVTTLVCDDQNPCTKDSCDPTSGCRTQPTSGGACDDGNACTQGDTCQAGQCVGGVAVVCNDNDPCTADACDPKKGCVFTPLAPCCGNRVVEAGESCDGGPGGTVGCGPDCRYRMVTLAAPPAGGRLPAVAWSEAAGSGLVAYEAASGNRSLVVRTVGADLSVGAERLVRNYGAMPVDGVAIEATPDGPEDFVAAVSRPVAVDLFVFDQDGTVTDSHLEAWTRWAVDLQYGGVGLGNISSGRFLVAWQDAVFCSGSSGVPVIRVGQADLAAGTFEPPMQVGSGTCDPWNPAVLGGVCGVEGAGVVVFAERQSQVQGGGKVVRQRVIPFGAQGLSEAVTVAESSGDLANPGTCGAAGDGKTFVIVYWDSDAVSQTISVRSVVVGRDGGVLGGPWTLQEVGSSNAGGTAICWPWFGSASGLVDGRFLLVCPMIPFSETGIPATWLRWRLLGPDGKPAGEFVPLGLQQAAFALGVGMAPGPRGDVLAAWYETDALEDPQGLMGSPGWLRLFALGKGTVW